MHQSGASRPRCCNVMMQSPGLSKLSRTRVNLLSLYNQLIFIQLKQVSRKNSVLAQALQIQKHELETDRQPNRIKFTSLDLRFSSCALIFSELLRPASPGRFFILFPTFARSTTGRADFYRVLTPRQRWPRPFSAATRLRVSSAAAPFQD